MPLAESNHVPDDEKVSGKAELRDHCEFVAHLRAGLVEQVLLGRRAVAFARAFVHAPAQERDHGFAAGRRIPRKFIAQVVERELKPLADDSRIGNRLGNLAEKFAHLLRRSQRARCVHRKQAPCPIERSVMTNRREDIQHLAIPFRCGAHAIAGNHGQVER